MRVYEVFLKKPGRDEFRHAGSLEASDAVGASRLQRLRWGVLPQVMPELASFILYRFEINIRASAVLGVVGAGGPSEAIATADTTASVRGAPTVSITAT